MRMADLNESGSGGVTCTVCHQIAPEGFGLRESFTGNFTINAAREIYGPHEAPFSMPMLHHTGYQATAGPHVQESALCATCHTVITPSLDAAGKTTGEFVEQAPFLEWLSSGYAKSGITCQSCHMPLLRDAEGREAVQYIAHRPPGGFFPPTRPRSPFALHLFAGGNAWMPGVLGESEAADRALDKLRGAARVRASADLAGPRLVVRITVENLAGHKLPTAFPSRRLWLHLSVADATGANLFESGAWDPVKQDIAGHGGFEPHYTTIDRPGQTMIYEAEYHDGKGRPVTSLLRAAGYRKDNRILPRGFDPARPLPRGVASSAIAPAGIGPDPDFLPGSDTVRYVIDTGSRRGPFRIVAEAQFESVKPAYAADLAGVNHSDAREFVSLYRKHAGPVTIGRVETVR